MKYIHPISTRKALAFESLYWVARIISTIAVYWLCSALYISIMCAMRGYSVAGNEIFFAIMPTFIYFCLFKKWFKGEKGEDKH